MAGLFHVSAKVGSRSDGKSAVASAAYRAAERLHDERDNDLKDFRGKQNHLQESAIVAPDSAPDWVQDRETLWNAAERAERRKDAQVYREFEVGLPRDVPANERMQVVQDWANENFVSKGMVADIAVHESTASDGREQPHAHVMLTMRPLDHEGQTDTGFARKKDPSWNHKSLVENARESWERHANRALERANSHDRIDHRSLEAQRDDAFARGDIERGDDLNRYPQPKLGPTANAMEQRGQETERGNERRWVERMNERMRQATQHTRDQINHLRERVEAVSRQVTPQWIKDAWQKRQNKNDGEQNTEKQQRNQKLNNEFDRQQRTIDKVGGATWLQELKNSRSAKNTGDRKQQAYDYFKKQEKNQKLDRVFQREQERIQTNERQQQRAQQQTQGRRKGPSR